MASAAVHALTLLLCRSKNKTLLSAIWKKGLLILGATSTPPPTSINKTTVPLGYRVLLRERGTQPGTLEYNFGHIGIRRLTLRDEMRPNLIILMLAMVNPTPAHTKPSRHVGDGLTAAVPCL